MCAFIIILLFYINNTLNEALSPDQIKITLNSNNPRVNSNVSGILCCSKYFNRFKLLYCAEV